MLMFSTTLNTDIGKDNLFKSIGFSPSFSKAKLTRPGRSCHTGARQKSKSQLMNSYFPSKQILKTTHSHLLIYNVCSFACYEQKFKTVINPNKTTFYDNPPHHLHRLFHTVFFCYALFPRLSRTVQLGLSIVVKRHIKM